MTISALNLAELNSEHNRPIYFLFMDLAGDPLYACTGVRSYTFNAQTWLGIGEIAGISEVAEIADVAARNLTLTLSGVDAWIVEPLRSRTNYKGRSVILYRGFLDADGELVDDPFVAWSGRMDVGTVMYDFGTAQAEMVCEPLAARLLRDNISRYSDEDHRLRHPADTFFIYLPQMEKKDVVWGASRVSPQGGGSVGSMGDTGAPKRQHH